MNWNKILAVIIVLIFILFFCAWLLLSVLAFAVDKKDALPLIASGIITFGFWFTVAYRLYYSVYP